MQSFDSLESGFWVPLRATAIAIAAAQTAEVVLAVMWDMLLDLGGPYNRFELRAIGALALGSRAQSGVCWEEDDPRDAVHEEGWAPGGTTRAHLPRPGQARELYEASVQMAEEALLAWEWRETEHEIWAARLAEASMFRDTWSPPSWWSDDD